MDDRSVCSQCSAKGFSSRYRHRVGCGWRNQRLTRPVFAPGDDGAEGKPRDLARRPAPLIGDHQIEFANQFRLHVGHGEGGFRRAGNSLAVEPPLIAAGRASPGGGGESCRAAAPGRRVGRLHNNGWRRVNDRQERRIEHHRLGPVDASEYETVRAAMRAAGARL